MSEAGMLTIDGVDYPIREEMLKQSDLSFYAENPRVFSLLNTSHGIPDQDLIEKTMRGFEHVKQLRISIKHNGGLIDPLIVRDGVVLEGNSRLAAYRLLCDEDPIKWGYVKCQVLPNNFPDDAVFALLGQYHVTGKTNWSPFEQGGFLVRQIRLSNKPVEYIAKVLGITTGNANSYVRTYEFMEQHDDLEPRRWSYYEEYLKNAGIKRYRNTSPDIDESFVEQVKSGQINEAIDVRNVFGAIAKSESREAKKIMNEIISGSMSIYDGYDELDSTGKIGNAYKVLQKFSQKIGSKEFEAQVANEDLTQIKYQLKQIRKKVNHLLGKMNEKRDEGME